MIFLKSKYEYFKKMDTWNQVYSLERRIQKLETRETLKDVPHMKGLIPNDGDIPVYCKAENRWVPVNIEKLGYVWFSHGSDKTISSERFGHIPKEKKDLYEENKNLREQNYRLIQKIATLESKYCI